MDIDLVPCFEFEEDKWPVGGYRKIPNTKKVGNSNIRYIIIIQTNLVSDLVKDERFMIIYFYYYRSHLADVIAVTCK